MVDTGTRVVVSAPDQVATPTGGPGVAGRWSLRVGLVLLGLQGVFLVGLSVVLYRRFTLGIDFGIFSQAWTQIGTGHLDPVSTMNGFPYVKSHFELLMWPLALLHLVAPSAIVLLFVQDLALVVTGMVVLTWVAALLRRSQAGAAWTVAVMAGTVALVLIDPVVYATAAEDFHFEPLATCFVVLAAYDLWSGRTTRMWLWAVLCLLCGDIGGLYVLGLGLSGVVAARGDRSRALVLVVVGVAWVGTISALGADVGSGISTGYAYLAGRQALPTGSHGLVLVAGGVVGHPYRAWDVLWSRWGTIFRYLEAGGGIGVLTPWGFGVPLVALGSSGLQSVGIFITMPFQNIVVVPFVTFGTAWLVVWIATRWRTWLGVVLATVVGAAALVAGGAEAAQQLPTAFTVNATAGVVGADQAAALGRALAATPADAEVIASVPIIGRFGQRPYLYTLVDTAVHTTAPVPVHADSVVVVIAGADAPELLPPSIAGQLQDDLVARGGQVVVDAAGVVAIVWHPPPGTTELDLP